MKKLFMSLAALAAVVGCSKVEEHNANVDVKQGLSLVASIEVEDTRVSVEGEKFTDVKWEQGDKVTLVSEAGVNTIMQSESAGDSDILFSGDSYIVAEDDTYYAVYPATSIVDGVATLDLSTQSGDDAAMLVASTTDVEDGRIHMSFKPANALLHVAVSGVESLSKAEFSTFDGSAVASTISYDFKADATSMGGGVDALVVNNPSADGFFFALPADLDMSNGYVVSLTDANGNVCTKAYNGKTFARGTTTRVEIEWSTPVVTLVAPKTSYSYYVADDIATANSCANNVIYFNSASTYANVQNAMVAEAGFIVDGKEYVANIDTATKSFSMGNVTVSSWGAKSVKAYIKTKDGKRYESAAETVYITGLPYSFKFYQSSDASVDAAGWKRNGGSSIKMELMTLHEGGLAGSDSGWVASPKYYAPARISTTATIQAKYYVAALFSPSGNKATLYVGATTSNTSSSSSSQSKQLSGTNNTTSSQAWTTLNVEVIIPAGEQYVSINHNKATYWSGSRIYLCNFELKYK
jgi:hypothetical protein